MIFDDFNRTSTYSFRCYDFLRWNACKIRKEIYDRILFRSITARSVDNHKFHPILEGIMYDNVKRLCIRCGAISHNFRIPMQISKTIISAPICKECHNLFSHDLVAYLNFIDQIDLVLSDRKINK